MSSHGEEDCINYGGVKRITQRRCCGGVVRDRVLLSCDIHKRIYSEDCNRLECPYFVKGGSNARKEG